MKQTPLFPVLLSTIILFVFLSCPALGSTEKKRIKSDLDSLIERRDAVVLADASGTIVYGKHANRKLIPASILKLFTSLVALNSLGKDYKFKTDFYTDADENLKIKGFGDPLLTSEFLGGIAESLAAKLDEVKDIVTDDSYFSNPISIPGTSTNSTQPYDAPNGALSVNFNTVNFKTSPTGKFVSAEPQTPLLPFVLPRITASSLDNGRIMLESHEIAPYAGHMIHWFITDNGITCTGHIRTGRIDAARDRLVLSYTSKTSMEDMIRQLLLYSNNFMANQMLLTAGAERYGPPGTMEKGVKAAREYAENVLHIKKQELDIIEGSGISRQNRISAGTFLNILKAFEPYRHLMRNNGRGLYKTGNLTGISTRAGYIEQHGGRFYYYVVMMNTPGRSSKPVMDKLEQLISR